MPLRFQMTQSGYSAESATEVQREHFTVLQPAVDAKQKEMLGKAIEELCASGPIFRLAKLNGQKRRFWMKPSSEKVFEYFGGFSAVIQTCVRADNQ